MSLPRLVATDLDGTLLRSDGTVSPRTASVLREVLDRGVEVAFVTAQTRSSLFLSACRPDEPLGSTF